MYLSQKVFLARGGTIKDNQKVTKVVPGDQVKVYTQDDVYTGLKLVVTAGPWTNKILKPLGSDLPLQVSVLNTVTIVPVDLGSTFRHKSIASIYCVSS